jgi:hypothetical protein
MNRYFSHRRTHVGRREDPRAGSGITASALDGAVEVGVQRRLCGANLQRIGLFSFYPTFHGRTFSTLQSFLDACHELHVKIMPAAITPGRGISQLPGFRGSLIGCNIRIIIAILLLNLDFATIHHLLRGMPP